MNPSERESIFFATIRIFFKSLAVMVGIFLSCLLFIFIFSIFSKSSMISDKTTPIIAANAQGNRELLPLSTPAILRINIHGVIGIGDLTAQTLKAQLSDSRRGFLKKERIKGILLHIKSPGGGAVDSYDMYMQLKEYKEKYHVPIFAFVDGICASGGMMIACAADYIESGDIGIIGSVGVRMGPNFNLSDLMEKIGIKQQTFTAGKDKDMLNPFRPWEKGEASSLRTILNYDYQMFVDLVVQNRQRISRNRLVNDYGAQVYDPPTAQQFGYIDDGHSSYNQTLMHLLKAAGIEENQPYQVVELKVIHPVIADLIEGKFPITSGKIVHQLDLGTDMHPELMNRSLYLYTPAVEKGNAY